MNRKIAILDLGTNTFHILIAEINYDTFRAVYKEKISVKIGQNGISQGYINKEAEIRAIDAVMHFKNLIVRQGISDVYANATSAFRNAANGRELAAKIENITGIKVNIISGDEEAELIYLGVKKALTIDKDVSLILDIGGGSNEFIICDNQKIYWKGSFEIGAQRLVDLFHNQDPIREEDMIKLELFLDTTLKKLTEAVKTYRPRTLIGASGTFDTLGDIYRAENDIVKLPGETEFEIPVPSYKTIHQDIVGKNKLERLRIPGMLEMRVDMIVVASSLINFVVRKYRMKQMRISAYSLKEGILHNILQVVNKDCEV